MENGGVAGGLDVYRLVYDCSRIKAHFFGFSSCVYIKVTSYLYFDGND